MGQYGAGMGGLMQMGRASVHGRGRWLHMHGLALLATNLTAVRIADWRYSVRDDEPVVVYGFPRTDERDLTARPGD
jgi:hypothetical protein